MSFLDHNNNEIRVNTYGNLQIFTPTEVINFTGITLSLVYKKRILQLDDQSFLTHLNKE